MFLPTGLFTPVSTYTQNNLVSSPATKQQDPQWEEDQGSFTQLVHAVTLSTKLQNKAEQLLITATSSSRSSWG